MAVHQRDSIPWAFPMRTSTLDDATRWETSSLTLYAPETGSRTFRSAYVEVFAQDAQSATAARANMAAWTIGIKLGSVAFDDATVTSAITDSAEHPSFHFIRDVTAYFQTNFGTGASQTCQVAFEFDSSSTTNPVILNNLVAILWVTYDYDDSGQDTRIAVACFDCESLLGGLTATLQEIGTNQIPALDTELEEASKVYRQIWLEAYGNEGNNATTDYQLAVAIDSGTETLFGTVEQACQSSKFVRYALDLTGLDTSAVHALKSRVTAASAQHKHMAFRLWVVYEYNHTTSTRLTRCVTLPFSRQQASLSATDAEQTWTADYWASEPGTLTLKRAAISLRWLSNDVRATGIYCGSQTSRNYAAQTVTGLCGQDVATHRIDSGSAAGAGMTLQQAGTKTQIVARFTGGSAARLPYASVGEVTLVYSCDKPAMGEGVCARTVRSCIASTQPYNETTFWNLVAPFATLPESSPSVVACTGVLSGMFLAGVLTNNAVTWDCSYESGEGPGDGWFSLIRTGVQVPAELSVGEFGGPDWREDCWRRYPGDLDTRRLNVETSRRHAINVMNGARCGFWSEVTYSSHQFAFTSTVQGSGGGTVTLRLCDAATGEALVQTTRVGDGDATLYWGDARPCYVEAYEDASHLGRGDTMSGTRVTA